MTYVAFESWMNTEASALYKEPKQEWSFVDKTPVRIDQVRTCSTDFSK